jgi:hypothetical protein
MLPQILIPGKARRPALRRLPKKVVLPMRTLIFALLLGAVACGSPVRTDLVVQFPSELREQPDAGSPVVCALPEGSELMDMHETSRFLTSISLADSLRTEPWLRVQTTDGRSGWVFGGVVAPLNLEPAAARRWFHEKRMQALFGPALSARIWEMAYRKSPATDTAFASRLHEVLLLRDTMNQVLARAVSHDAAAVPANLTWLQEPMQYFFVQHTPTPRLFTDFRLIARAAAGTRGEQDDQFARIGFAAYPMDSVESVLPAWVFPLGLEESCSNLGAGFHLDMLTKISAALLAGDLFQPELLRWKDQILADMLDDSRTYWQPKEKILAELDRILAAGLCCLSDRDLLALKARRGMFSAGRVRMDLRSGKESGNSIFAPNFRI